MQAEIITSGTELLLGEITDTNTPFLASRLAALGIDLFYVSTFGDNFDRFYGILKQAWERSDIILITVGLGPTRGDLTRDVIARLLGEEMRVDDGIVAHLEKIFKSYGYGKMPENNIKQAMLIHSAGAIPNSLGTAPGWWVEKAGKILISMPGPPGELQNMWNTEVGPRLEKLSGSIILSRMLKTWGLGECTVDEKVAPFMAASNPTLALYARPDGVYMRVTAKANTREEAAKLITSREAELRAILGENIWGADDETLESNVAAKLNDKKLTFAIADAFTGGLLAYSLAGAENPPSGFRGALTVTLKTRSLLGIAAINPSPESASIMAVAARRQFSAQTGIAIDGIIDSSGKTAAGRMYIAIATDSGIKTVEQAYSGRPRQIIRRCVNHALLNLGKWVGEK